MGMCLSAGSWSNGGMVYYCAITGLVFFILGLLLGRRWRSRPAGGAMRRMDNRRPALAARPAPGRPQGPVEIYVGNLPLETTKEEVEKEFGRYGKVQSIRLITKHGEDKSFGFVEMPVPAEADEAIKALSGRDFKGSPLEVNVAKSPRGHRRHHRR